VRDIECMCLYFDSPTHTQTHSSNTTNITQAEFFADILLCPWETLKLKVQTTDIGNWVEGKSDGYAKGLRDGLPKLVAEGGVGGMCVCEG
jgi:hypothetical protein